MKAMLLYKTVNLATGRQPLVLENVPVPIPRDDEILIRVSRCGVCHTELDEIEGRTSPTAFPVIPGHQIVGRVAEKGTAVTLFNQGDRVGVAWIFSACGVCEYCRTGNENLCADFKATGRDANGGYAEYMTVSEKFAYPIPGIFSDSEAAPLLCAGAVGYRSVVLSGIRNGQRLGLTGFGASAHLVLKMIKYQYPEVSVFVFARDPGEQKFALELGAGWAGNTQDRSPEKLHAIIDTTPAWTPVVEAMKNLEPGGRLIINAIRKEDRDRPYLLNLNYHEDLWMEKQIKSVANVTRKDVREFLQLAAEIPIKPVIEEYRLEDANRALTDLKNKKSIGAKVLVIA
ncbi:zinc-dependent alcohol dehydrogenase family protein [Chryseobacterium sp. MDT2-18]|uniref:zinc-dependent alcohol dehydrogenase family protein n=1 Tax=Chryseobacterium sp. MDT2-18 TaxID=1259136 RepID=UPI0027871EE3|nr:zinc-dependent alcohol dehydrogenase family protein [Chryseobacterium sp. MDT2-18]MDQ0477266.1 propanol-preferring alcohol dehydrogenase [Chryseobacterium sp. MDT2-18]